MKNLNLFLWIFTTAITIFFAYYTYTHTRIRYKDLESVMQQNLVVEKGIKITKLDAKKQYLNGIDLTEMQGNTPKDKDLLQKATNIREETATILQAVDSLMTLPRNLKNDSKVNLQNENILLLQKYDTSYTQFITNQDTCLWQLEKHIFPLIDTEKHYLPFALQNKLALQYKISRVEWKSNDRLISKIGGVMIRCYFGSPVLVTAKSEIVKSGNTYKALMFITDYTKRFNCSMKVSEGSVTYSGSLGKIAIPNVKAQNYNSEGKATKILTGKITIMKTDGSDTTFTLSTSYIVKKK